MSTENFTTSILVDQSPEEVFDAINNVRGWWSGEIEGHTDREGEAFTYTVPNVHFSRQRITELTPGKTIVWKVADATLSFVENATEWKDTTIRFDILKNGDRT